MTRHSRQDALNESEFEALLEGARSLPSPRDVEAEFVVVAAGRLGLRAAEIQHMRESWVDWEREIIQIPTIQSCECGYCKAQARQSAEKTDKSYEEALSTMWSPKTSMSARAIPFDWDEEVRQVVKGFYFDNNAYPKSRSSINRRVDDAAEAAGWNTDRVYPHALRATAATHHAYRGLTAAALQALMGWADIQVAMKYIKHAGGATQDALNDVYGDD